MAGERLLPGRSPKKPHFPKEQSADILSRLGATLGLEQIITNITLVLGNGGGETSRRIRKLKEMVLSLGWLGYEQSWGHNPVKKPNALPSWLFDCSSLLYPQLRYHMFLNGRPNASGTLR